MLHYVISILNILWKCVKIPKTLLNWLTIFANYKHSLFLLVDGALCRWPIWIFYYLPKSQTFAEKKIKKIFFKFCLSWMAEQPIAHSYLYVVQNPYIHYNYNIHVSNTVLLNVVCTFFSSSNYIQTIFLSRNYFFFALENEIKKKSHK